MNWDELKRNLNREETEGPVVFTADDLVFSLTPSESGEAVLLSAGLAPLPQDDSGRALREMLEANHLFAGTGGASLSVDPETLRPLIQQTLWIGILDFEGFMVRLEAFVSRAAEWNRKVAEAPAPEAEPLFWPGNEGFIIA